MDIELKTQKASNFLSQKDSGKLYLHVHENIWIGRIPYNKNSQAFFIGIFDNKTNEVYGLVSKKIVGETIDTLKGKNNVGKFVAKQSHRFVQPVQDESVITAAEVISTQWPSELYFKYQGDTKTGETIDKFFIVSMYMWPRLKSCIYEKLQGDKARVILNMVHVGVNETESDFKHYQAQLIFKDINNAQMFIVSTTADDVTALQGANKYEFKSELDDTNIFRFETNKVKSGERTTEFSDFNHYYDGEWDEEDFTGKHYSLYAANIVTMRITETS